MEEQELKQEMLIIDEKVSAVIVNSKEMYEQAGTMVIELDSLKKKINEYWDEPIKKAHEAHKSLTAKRAEMLKPVEDRRKSLTNKISAYLTEIERARRVEQEKLDEERRLQEQFEREKLQKQAMAAALKGKSEKAEALQAKVDAVYVPSVIVQPEVEKTTRMDEGTISQMKDIKITVTDIHLLLAEIISGKIPVGVITINDTKLKQSVKLAGLRTLSGCIIEEVVTAKFKSK